MKKYDIALITDYQRFLGFRLSSFSNIFYVSTVDEGNELIRKMYLEQKYGLILVSSHVYDSDNEEIKSLTKRTFPLLVEVPISGKNFSLIGEARILEYLRKSIGYSIKF